MATTQRSRRPLRFCTGGRARPDDRSCQERALTRFASVRAGADLNVKGCASGTVLGWCGDVVIFIVAGRACSSRHENDGSRSQHWKWYGERVFCVRVHGSTLLYRCHFVGTWVRGRKYLLSAGWKEMTRRCTIDWGAIISVCLRAYIQYSCTEIWQGAVGTAIWSVHYSQ